MQSPEPLLDVVRGLSTVASFGIVMTQVKDLWTGLFIDECPKCRGTGMTVCKMCNGTANLRSRPARPMKVTNEKTGQVKVKPYNPSGFNYECGHCGTNAPDDWDLERLDDDIQDANMIMANIRTAVAGKTVGMRQFAPTKGVEICPCCQGNPMVFRHTPNLARVLGLEEPFWLKSLARSGRLILPADFDANGRFHMMEYPSNAKPYKNPVPKKYNFYGEKKSGNESGLGVKDAYSAMDYVWPFVGDDDDGDDSGLS